MKLASVRRGSLEGGQQRRSSFERYVQLGKVCSLVRNDDTLYRQSFRVVRRLRGASLTLRSGSKPTNQNWTSVPSPPDAVGWKLGLASQRAE
jgi:hypothetical protein